MYNSTGLVTEYRLGYRLSLLRFQWVSSDFSDERYYTAISYGLFPPSYYLFNIRNSFSVSYGKAVSMEVIKTCVHITPLVLHFCT